ncbi:MAG: Pr6Pr family membrane protein [Ruminococcus sp.]|nr:Pr6Pr family membrane protein [Ruminococcus sp.]
MGIPKNKRILSVILKCIVILAASVGTFLSAISGMGGFMSGSRVFMYFTIQSNIAVALVSAAGLVLMLRGKEISGVWYVLDYVGAVSITMTCSVFTFVLAPTLGDLAWTVYNVLTHLIVPIAFIVDFFIIAVYGDIKKTHLPLVLIPPLAYGIYAEIAYFAGWEFLKGQKYPYFFLNWDSPAGAFGFCEELPFMGCVWWITALGIVFILVGIVYLLIVNKIKRKMKRS